MSSAVDLGGTWRAAPADEALRRAFPAPGFDDAAWETVSVPGHWRSVPAFAQSDGPVLYRRPFDTPSPADGRRSWLTLDGVFYDGDVWLDGAYLGATEGYFFPHTFEVTDALAARADHTLAVEVGCTPPSDRTAKRALTGVFQHWECIDPDWNPGGIWRPVQLTETGSVRIARLRVLCAEATAERARLDIRAVLDAPTATSALLHVVVRDQTGDVVADLVSRHPLARGENRIRLPVAVQNPALWWPHALGAQPLHEVAVEVLVPDGAVAPPARGRRGKDQEISAEELAGHIPSDVRRLRTGLRQVRMTNWIMTVNGERLFLKGANHGPGRAALADAAAAELEGDVTSARRAGLDLLRLYGHITRPEVYDAADRIGMLLWQDLPLHRGYARTVRRQAVRQAREAVDLLGHHPSIAVWCGHSEPTGRHAPTTSTPARFVASQEVPTWNKTVLDMSIGRALERADSSRPIVRHSGVLPGPVASGTDSHLYLGWYHGSERDLPRLISTVPRLARFVGEFGAQAVPSSDGFLSPADWPDLDWARLEQHHGLQRSVFDRRLPPTSFASFDAWRDATQAYQAEVIRYHVETLRRVKYRPAGGFCQFMLADAQPAVTWSVLDHDRIPKAAYEALRSACAPVIVVAERPAVSYLPGSDVTLDVHVVSDLRRPLVGARVIARLGAVRWGWEGDVPADACIRVGRFTAPAVEGFLELSLEASDGEPVSVSASYPIVLP